MSDQSPQVSLSRCAEYNPAMLRRAITAALAPFGGMEGLVQRGDQVLLKPNLVMGRPPERAVNTHPALVQAVAEQVRDCGGEVLVGDSPGLESAARAARACGLDKVVKRVGGRIIEFTIDPRAEKREGFLGDLDMARQLQEVDVHLNLPKFKTHELTALTLGVKNCFGTVVGMRKFQWHYRAGHNPDLFARMLVDVYRKAAPQMTILDAVVGMEGRGPTAGTPRKLGFIAAARDCLALDAVGAKIVNLDLLEVPTLSITREAGATAYWENPEVIGAAIDELRVLDFKHPAISVSKHLAPSFLTRFLRKRIVARPKPDAGKCTGCGVCAGLCPAKAITMRNQLPVLDAAACICCYCCQEFCPEAAMRLSLPLLFRLLNRGGRKKPPAE